MYEVEVYAICDADSVSPGWVQPFTLARSGAGGAVEPFPIVIVRDDKKGYFAYINICPHVKHPLYEGPQQYLDSEHQFLICAKHGAKFQIDTGLCVEGPCKGARLESIPAAVIDGDVCLAGVTLVEEEDGPPEVMITAD
jgi:nitrite reductase/ring-hydroxylating ferredoxin subunit